jgi:hypothetical protein
VKETGAGSSFNAAASRNPVHQNEVSIERVVAVSKRHAVSAERYHASARTRLENSAIASI